MQNECAVVFKTVYKKTVYVWLSGPRKTCKFVRGCNAHNPIHASTHTHMAGAAEDDRFDFDVDDDGTAAMDFAIPDAAVSASRPDFVDVPVRLQATAAVHFTQPEGSVPWDLRTGALWSVDAKSITPAQVEAHMRVLTCVPNKGKKTSFGGAGKKPETFTIGHVKDGRLYMPPAYARAAFPNAPIAGTELQVGEPMRAEAVFAGSLWQTYPPQQHAVNAFQAYAAANPTCAGCILSLPCGHGKSVVCLYITAVVVRRVTLILMHMCGLVDQWIEEAKRYVPGARVGYITADAVRVDGVDIIIASIHSLSSHIERGAAYLPTLFARVGFVILDEAHHGVARTFQSVMACVPAARRMAVTATPRRSDGLFEELQFIFGPVAFRSYRRTGDAQVLMLQYINPAIKERTGWGGQLALCDMEDDLVNDAVLNALVVDMVTMLATTQGRRVLIVTPRVRHVETLAAALEIAFAPHASALSRHVDVITKPKAPVVRKRPRESEEDAAARKAAARAEFDDAPLPPPSSAVRTAVPLVGRVTREMKPPERKLNFESHAVVTTYNIMKEGVSFNDWDTLVDLDNTMDPEQVVGRIQRAGDKKVPLVIDVWTPVSLWNAMKAARLRFYTGENFTVAYKTVHVEEPVLPPAAFWQRYNRKATAIL